jgi:hypothetical protein
MHPLARAFAALALLRASMIVALSVQAHHAGMTEPLAVIASSLALHIGVTLLEASVVLGIWWIAPSRALALSASALAFGLALWSIVDPIVYLLAGDHLTLSLLGHFAGFKIFRSDYLWKPVQAYWPLVSAGLAGVAALTAFFARCARAALREDREVPFEDRGRFPSEREMVREIAHWLSAHDSESSSVPVLIDWKTAHPHMPYEVPDDALGIDRSFGAPRDNYAHSLAYVDAAIGELVAALRARPRWRDTLIIVLGDHSNWLVSTRTTALPSDEMVWTGALIAGCEERIGPPRRVLAPASQVDLLPTLMRSIGDVRPTAALGRDLLADPPTRPVRAVAVRPGGLRLDAEGATLLADRRHLHGADRRCSFAAAGDCSGSRDTSDLARHVDTWGWLVDENRVFDRRWLAPSERSE